MPQAVEQSTTLLRYPTTRKRPYRNPSIARRQYPENVVPIQPPAEEREVSADEIQGLIVSAVIHTMPKAQRQRLLDALAVLSLDDNRSGRIASAAHAKLRGCL